MGLDMYLNRFQRYRGATASDIVNIESYCDWLADKETKSKFSLKEWCGISERDLPSKDVVSHYSKLYNAKPLNEYGFKRICEEVCYWRKANQIHKWFVDHCQDGEDDCRYHSEVTEWQLQELIDTCQDVILRSRLVHGKVKNGTRYADGAWLDITEDGLVIEDPQYAMEHLPRDSGFFFGSESYDERYIAELKRTVDILQTVLDTTNFETQMLYYVSSW